MSVRNWVNLFLLFGGFLTASTLGLPLTVAMHGVNSLAAAISSIVMYVAIGMTILIDAWSNCRVHRAAHGPTRPTPTML